MSSSPQPARLVSLDAFRGAVMLLMASSGLSLPKVAKERFPDSPAWRFVGEQCDHAAWVGCTLWDVIQPAFMFMVGVAVPWSVANRQARGERFGRMFAHAVWRAVLLVLLAVFLTSAWSRRTEWVFTSVLAQIGLGYPFLFLLAFARPRVQWAAAFGILAAVWLAFAAHPLPPADFDWKNVGVPDDWPHLSGLAAHWEKGANVAAAFDRRFLNLFPREAAYTHNVGGYQTLNFVPSLATMIFGLLAGRLLKSDRPVGAKVARLVAVGAVGMLLGQTLGWADLCPVVKRIWSPAWVLYSGGLVAVLLAGFVAVIDGAGWRRWAFPLVVAGLNPIALYVMWQLMGGFVRQQLQVHLGQHVFAAFGDEYTPIAERAATLLVFWLILFGMYRRRVFIRL